MKSKLKAIKFESDLLEAVEQYQVKENRSFSNAVKTLLRERLINPKQ